MLHTAAMKKSRQGGVMSPLSEEEDANDPLFGDWTEDNDDDDAPEAVSFNQGREEAMESISNALQDIQRSKLKAKEKRRERDRLLKEQKQRRKVSLSNARLPQELLDKLAQQQDPTSRLSEQSPEITASESVLGPVVGDEGDADDLSDYDNSDEEDQHSSNLQVIQSSKIAHPPPHEAALQFLQNQMYGKRIHRESTAKNMSRKQKRLGKPGINFRQKRKEEVKRKRRAVSDVELPRESIFTTQ